MRQRMGVAADIVVDPLVRVCCSDWVHRDEAPSDTAGTAVPP